MAPVPVPAVDISTFAARASAYARETGQNWNADGLAVQASKDLTFWPRQSSSGSSRSCARQTSSASSSCPSSARALSLGAPGTARASSASSSGTAASSASAPKRLPILCPDLLRRGVCRLPNCPYVHEVTKARRLYDLPASKTSSLSWEQCQPVQAVDAGDCSAIPCRFLKVLGRCTYGDSCVYSHDLPPSGSSSASGGKGTVQARTTAAAPEEAPALAAPEFSRGISCSSSSSGEDDDGRGGSREARRRQSRDRGRAAARPPRPGGGAPISRQASPGMARQISHGMDRQISAKVARQISAIVDRQMSGATRQTSAGSAATGCTARTAASDAANGAGGASRPTSAKSARSRPSSARGPLHGHCSMSMAGRCAETPAIRDSGVHKGWGNCGKSVSLYGNVL
eukprot:TRINITY_DN23363_c0_g1_i1.p1 TRINITY_DN23363_c0_g1~~TRINITY_DN23363_c0_g1_i1.p1  ORF type:complete len:408 (+),score=40.35 TRINITY_DN23363_c0_g1_i1:26-1225(+)